MIERAKRILKHFVSISRKYGESYTFRHHSLFAKKVPSVLINSQINSGMSENFSNLLTHR